MGDVESDVDDQFGVTTSSESSMFSLTYLRSQAHCSTVHSSRFFDYTSSDDAEFEYDFHPTPILWDASNCFHVITVSPTIYDDSVLTGLSDPKEGLVGDRLVRGARKIFKVTTRKFCGL